MNILWLAVLVIAVISASSAFVWMALTVKKSLDKNARDVNLLEKADEAADAVFNKEFREELKNRGRLHFEKVINENAMFLQQDLRLTTSQLNEFMKEEIKNVLKEEFSTYEESITHAKDQAIEAIEKTKTVIENQRDILEKELQEQLEKDREAAISAFEKNMGKIVNHYILETLGNEIDLSDQLNYIFDSLEENKQAILEDIRNGT